MNSFVTLLASTKVAPVDLARRCNVTPQAVDGWKKKGLPADKVLAVAKACDFALTPHELRPDLYPHPDDGLPADRRMAKRARAGGQ